MQDRAISVISKLLTYFWVEMPYIFKNIEIKH